MRNIFTIILTFIFVFGFAQTKEEEQTRIDKILTEMNQKKVFNLYKELVIEVQDKSVNVSEAMFPDPYDFINQKQKQDELLEEYKLVFIQKHTKMGMSSDMILRLDIYGTRRNWHKLFRNLYNQK